MSLSCTPEEDNLMLSIAPRYLWQFGLQLPAMFYQYSVVSHKGYILHIAINFYANVLQLVHELGAKTIKVLPNVYITAKTKLF